MRTALIILAAALAAWPFWRPAFADKPEGVAATFAANDFYRTCLKLDPRGLPTTQHMKRFAPLFTEELTAIIEDARSHRNWLLRENSTNNVPWREGNLFVSLERGITFYAIGFPVIQDDVATVPIHLEFHERGRIARWMDIIVLERSGKDWLVADIFLNAPWPLTSGSSLRSRLLMPMHQVTIRPANGQTVGLPVPEEP